VLFRSQLGASGAESSKRGPEAAELERLREENKRFKAATQQTSDPKPQNNAGGGAQNRQASKSKMRLGRREPALPAELREYKGLMVKYGGRNICYSYNMRNGAQMASVTKGSMFA